VKWKNIEITNPERVVIAGSKITKGNIVEYYMKNVKNLLSYITNYPVTILRSVGDYKKSSMFIQRHPSESFPAYIERIKVEGKTETEVYMTLDSEEDIAYLVNQGAIEFHVWNAKADTIDTPNRIIFDLDPIEGEKLSIQQESVVQLDSILVEYGIRAFWKTSGIAGYHAIIPINPVTWNVAKEFALKIANEVSEKYPKLFTTESRKVDRQGAVFVDYLRNYKSASTVALYSLRAINPLTHSTPFNVNQLISKGISPKTTLEQLFNSWKVADFSEYMASNTQSILRYLQRPSNVL